ncbi:MAG: asparagine synthase-related protein [bacterium]
MIIYWGNDFKINKRIEESNYRLVIKEEILTVLIEPEQPYPETYYENHPDLLLVIEGGLLHPSDRKKIMELYKEYHDEFVIYLQGVYNLLLWDKIKGKIIVANDKLGSIPFFYHIMKDGSEFFASTRLKAIMELVNIEKKINKTALTQFAFFNYITGRDTFIKGINQFLPGTRLVLHKEKIMEERYYSVAEHFAEKPITEEEMLTTFPKILLQVISEWVRDKKRVGILLSGGYDSRILLACLMKLGIAGNAYTWHNPQVEETGIAREIARIAGFRHRYLSYYPEEKVAEENIFEAGRITEFAFPFFHVGRYNAVKEISSEVDIIFSGQGEIIRRIPIPNDYINAALVNYLKNGTLYTKNIDHFFSITNDMLEPLLDTLQYKDCTFTQKLTLFLLVHAYRSDYCILRYAESQQKLVAMPFLDSRIIQILLRSPFSIARLKTWNKDIRTTFFTRKLYFRLLKEYAPELLDVPVDRGYPPRYDACSIGLLMTVLWGLKNLINAKRIADAEISAPWRILIKKILGEPRTLKRGFYDNKRLLDKIKNEEKWTPVESYELEKVARFELGYRYFVEKSI